MKIGFFVRDYPPRIGSETGKYAGSICPAMVKLEHHVSVFTLNDGTLKTREILKGVDVNRPLLVEAEEDKILSFCVNKDLRKLGAGINFNNVLVYNILSAAKFVNELVGKEGYEFDIICAHDWQAAIAGIMVKDTIGSPFVFYLHSLEVINLERIAAAVADKVIVESDEIKQELIRLGFDGNKIEVVGMGNKLAARTIRVYRRVIKEAGSKLPAF